MCVSMVSDTPPSVAICPFLIIFHLEANSLFCMHGESSFILGHVNKQVNNKER
jgi:hypothetical protein